MKRLKRFNLCGLSLVTLVLIGGLTSTGLGQCIVEINSITTPDPSASPLVIVVEGKVTEAECDSVTVTLVCPAGTQSVEAAVQGDGTWTAVFDPSVCECGQQITVNAQCGNCTPATATEFIDCPDGECPTIIDIDVNILDCEVADGLIKRKVEFTANFTGSPTFYNWTFGDGTSSGVTPIAGPPPLISGVAFEYYYETAPTTAPTLELIGPGMCLTSASVPLSEFEGFEICSECPIINDIIIESIPLTCDDVAAAGGTWIVKVNANISNIANVDGAFQWSFGDGTGNVYIPKTNPDAPKAEHEYLCPNSGKYYITLTVDCKLDPAYDHDLTETITLPACDCPLNDDDEITDDINDCTVDFNATISGTCLEAVTEYIWNFDDGISETIPATKPGAPATSHTYTANGTYTVTLTLGGVSSKCALTKEIEITNCGDDDDDDDDDGSGGFCGCTDDTPLCIFGIDICCILFGLFIVAVVAALVFLARLLCGDGSALTPFLISLGIAIALAIILFLVCDIDICTFLLGLAGSGFAGFAVICGFSVLPPGCDSFFCTKTDIPGIGGVANLLIIDILFTILVLIICALI